jgi:hypothetical protein
MKLCFRAGCPIASGSRVAQALINNQRLSEKQKERARSFINKSKRLAKTNMLYKLYDKKKKKLTSTSEHK